MLLEFKHYTKEDSRTVNVIAGFYNGERIARPLYKFFFGWIVWGKHFFCIELIFMIAFIYLFILLVNMYWVLYMPDTIRSTKHTLVNKTDVSSLRTINLSSNLPVILPTVTPITRDSQWIWRYDQSDQPLSSWKEVIMRWRELSSFPTLPSMGEKPMVATSMEQDGGARERQKSSFPLSPPTPFTLSPFSHPLLSFSSWI